MTETTSPARANRDGHLCPPWCVTDHDRFSFHGSGPITVEAPQYHSCHVRAIQYATHGGPEIQVAGAGMVPVPAAHAEDLAAVIEQMADATPDEHRELAAAIRQAAADIAAADSTRPE
jgi:hypothetical protein